MIEIKELLLGFDKLLLKGEGKKVFVKEIIKEVLSVDVETKDIDFRNGVLYLNLKPIYKNEIFLKKDFILSKLKNYEGSKFLDVR